MPLYGFQCPCCNRVEDYFLQISERDDTRPCPDCQEGMARLIEAPPARPFTPYYHHQLGQTFMTRDEERQWTKKHGMVDITGESKAVKHGRSKWLNS